MSLVDHHATPLVQTTEPPSLRIAGPRIPGDNLLFTPEALHFVGSLVARFEGTRRELLARRETRQVAFDAGARPDFLQETEKVRRGDWKVARLPKELLSRGVEITGPVERKMIINALNSGADVFMADFEDSNAPSWENIVRGQLNLRDAVRGTIDYMHPLSGKRYRLGEDVATLMVRPRGLHLDEKHLEFDGQAVSAAFVDFGFYFFHNAHALLERNSGPYFYLPKLENHLEARLFNDVFVFAQEALGIPRGTIKATVLIETLPAAFEMDEILHELADHAAGLNCGRWDYIFSYIKTLREHADCVIPDRAQVGMTQPFMRAYTQLLIRTCHRRGALAMGGMAAQIPIRNDADANKAALDKVRADKEREAADGHDGTWVAHPGLVAVAREAFAKHMHGDNQLDKLREDVTVDAADLLRAPTGSRTEMGLRHNIRVGVQYLEAWLRGQGCVPIEHLMEDAATAEICRTQLWQWLKHRALTDDGQAITSERIGELANSEMRALTEHLGEERIATGEFAAAKSLFLELSTDISQFTPFLTLPAYEQLTQTNRS